MSIAPGTQLGPYEILAPIGVGGMGEVYKARDTRLERTVAIKVLPEHLSKDPTLRERFEREARAVSSLNHPHICTLYDVGEHNGVHFLVMEYIEGETLADRLKKGALPLELALEYAAQIADALHNAHREGVVHRDLKPGNIMLIKPGVKLLDFGLAKTREESLAPTEDSEQPTRHKPLTDAGTILGTVQYMAPEQLEGKEVDARADLFAFGAVLYKMLTGRKAFDGESQASLISAIMSTEPPPVSELQPVSPPALDRVVKKCLAKDPDVRWQTARDLWDELTWIRTRPEMEPSASAPIASRSRLSALVAVLVALGAAAIIWYAWPRPSPPRVSRFAVGAGAGENLFASGNAPGLAVSPDGRFVGIVVFGRSRQIAVRDLSELEFRQLRGTEGVGYHPFFSPDGEWIAFTTRGVLRKIRVGGGNSQIICNFNGAFSGGSWLSGDRILFSSRLALHLVSASGGNIETLLELEDEAESLLYPRWLPGGRHALVTVRRGNEETLYSFSLESRELRTLLPNASQAHYLESGHLVYRRPGGVSAIRFDPDPPSLLGEPVSVAEPIGSLTGGGAFFAVSESGTLVYRPTRTALNAQLLWSDHRGLTTPLPIEPDVFRRPSVSPDGRRLAIDTHRGASKSMTFGSTIWTRTPGAVLPSKGTTRLPCGRRTASVLHSLHAVRK